MRCQKTKRDGNMCKANALIGKKYCALHSDDGRADELGSRGGRRRTMFDPEKLMSFPPPKTAAEVRDLLAQSIVELRAGQLDPRIAASICCLVTEFLKSLEVCTIEEVIEPLEREHASESRFKDAINRNKENTAAQN